MFITLVLQAIGRMRARRNTARELARLSDRDLADIGLTRAQIDEAAAGTLVRIGL